ncbi:hypothetical protein TNCV_2940291 [Trichonephila clavipes]|nr:hypothetical protein TNCV_2940291 [Trichonephila clavipes]
MADPTFCKPGRIGELIGRQWGNSTYDLIYKPNASLPLEGAASVLDWDYGKCLTEPTKTFCHKTEKERAKILAEKQNMKYQPQEMSMDQQEMKDNAPSGNVTSIAETKHHWHPIHSLLHTFSLMMMSLDIRPLILEPSILYCTLSPTYKMAALKRGFSPSRFKGSRQIITVGIFERDSVILKEEESRNMVSDYGFQMEVVQQGILNETGNEVIHSHFFFNHHDLVVHAVVFFYANTFFTHFGLPQKDTEANLLFNVNSAYENVDAHDSLVVGNSWSVLLLGSLDSISGATKDESYRGVIKCSLNMFDVQNTQGSVVWRFGQRSQL